MKSRVSIKHNRKHNRKHTKKHTHKHTNKLPKTLPIKLYKNEQGTRLLFTPSRTESESSSIYFYFKVGSKDEPKNINGISHFIEHMIFKGSPKFPNYLDISKTFDANGIEFNAFTSKDMTAYHYKFLSTKENIDIICKITSDMIMNPLMREREIKTERNVIIQEYNDDLDDVDEYIADKLEECLLEGHPLGQTIIGSLETIKSINRKDMMTYHKKHYRSDNLLIGFSGKMRSEYEPIIEKYFGGSGSFKPISIKNVEGSLVMTPFVDKHPFSKVDCFPKELKQDYIHIIFKTKGYFDPMKNHLRLIKNIMGSNMSSRLFVEIREKLGLVYSIRCEISNYEDMGYFDITAQTEVKDTVKCIDAVFKELVKLKKFGIDEKELKDNKKNYCDIYQTNFDDIEYENEYYSKQILLNRPIETREMRIGTIQAITAKELHDVALDIFDFNKVHIITFGEVKKHTIQKILDKYMEK